VHAEPFGGGFREVITRGTTCLEAGFMTAQVWPKKGGDGTSVGKQDRAAGGSIGG
jgi:hypothetical protein